MEFLVEYEKMLASHSGALKLHFKNCPALHFLTQPVR